MVRQLLILVLLSISLVTHADPPPVSIKGQNSAKLLPKWNLQVPNSSVTNLGGIDALLETGNTNLLANPSFEGSPFLTGWTCANFTCSSQTTYFSDGKQGGTVTNANSINTVVEQSVTPLFPTANRTFNPGWWVNTNAAGFQVCGLFNGTEQGCNDVPANSQTVFVRAPLFQPTTAGTVGIRLKSTTASAKQIFWDSAELNAAPLGFGYPSTPPISYTPTFFGITVSSPTCTYQQVQNFYAIFCRITSTGSNGTNAQFNLPNGAVADPLSYPGAGTFGVGKLNADSNGNTQYFGAGSLQAYGNSSQIYLAAEANGINSGAPQPGTSIGSGSFILTALVAIKGLSPLTAINSANSNYDWRSFTTVATNATISSQSCLEKREGPNNKIKCNIQFSAGTASPIQLTMPNGNVIESAKFGVVVRRYGSGNYAGTGGNTHAILATGGNNYFGMTPENNASYTPSVSMNGSALGTASNYSFEAEFPIAGWSENQNAPQLIGSVTSPAPGAEGIYRAQINNNGTTASIASQSGSWLSSVSRTGTGIVSYVFAASVFTSSPTCVAACINAFSTQLAARATTTGVSTICGTAAGAATDQAVDLICTGSK